MSGPPLPIAQRDLVFFDLESSGFHPEQGHELLELAAVRVTGDIQTEFACFERKCTMVNPSKADAKALEKNRYTHHAWKNSEPARVALVDFQVICGGMTSGVKPEGCEPVLAGHGIQNFDLPFLKAIFAQNDLVFPTFKYVADTFAIAWPLAAKGLVGSLSLKSLCERYAIDNTGSHRAMADVRRTIALYCKLLGLKVPVPKKVEEMAVGVGEKGWDAL